MKPDHAAEFSSARRLALRACWIRTLTPAPIVRRAGKRKVCMAKSIPAVGQAVDLAFCVGAFYIGARYWLRWARMPRPRSGVEDSRWRSRLMLVAQDLRQVSTCASSRLASPPGFELDDRRGPL